MLTNQPAFAASDATIGFKWIDLNTEIHATSCCCSLLAQYVVYAP